MALTIASIQIQYEQIESVQIIFVKTVLVLTPGNCIGESPLPVHR